MLWIILETAIQIQKGVYLCFIYYTKAFDEVRHKYLVELLGNIDTCEKAIRITPNIYWQKTSWILIENDFSKNTRIWNSVKEECLSLPYISTNTSKSFWEN